MGKLRITIDDTNVDCRITAAFLRPIERSRIPGIGIFISDVFQSERAIDDPLFPDTFFYKTRKKLFDRPHVRRVSSSVGRALRDGNAEYGDSGGEGKFQFIGHVDLLKWRF